MSLFPKQTLHKQINDNKKVEKINQRASQRRRLISGTMLGFAAVCIVQMLGLSQLDVALKVSLYAFAVSIPFHTMEFFDRMAEERYGIGINLPFRQDFMATALLISLVGVIGLFWHFSLVIAILFVGTTFTCFGMHALYLNALEKARDIALPRPNNEGRRG